MDFDVANPRTIHQTNARNKDWDSGPEQNVREVTEIELSSEKWRKRGPRVCS